MTRGVNGARCLERALLASAREARLDIAIEATSSRPWASALFVGEHVQIRMRGADTNGLAGWLAGLADADLPISGYCVADLAIDHDRPINGDRQFELLVLVLHDANGEP